MGKYGIGKKKFTVEHTQQHDGRIIRMIKPAYFDEAEEWLRCSLMNWGAKGYDSYNRSNTKVVEVY